MKHLKRIAWLGCAVVLLCKSGLGAERPNIVFLFADDQRADTIGAHGNAFIQTPNLDQLAADGFSFRRNYCAGSYSGAVCVASRAMLMTGHYWKRIQAKSNTNDWAGLRLLPEVLANGGDYRTHIVGKWHNGEKTLRRSFESGKSVYLGGMVNQADFVVQDYVDGTISDKRPAGGFSSKVFADAAVEFIDEADKAEPYFLYVAFTAPHDTRNPPLEYREQYYDNRPPLPENFLPEHPFNNAPQTVSGRDEGLAPWPRTEDVIGDQLCEYYGLITHLDEQVGRIIDAVNRSGQADNTYIVYTADHGLAMGSHGLLGKQNVYEQSMSSPLILRGPGIPANQSTAAYSYVHDLFATVCGFADVPLPEDVDAVDLAPLWRGETEQVHASMFLPFQDSQRTICDGRWKLHIYPLINHRLLFDLETDPHETNNLAEHPKQAERVVALTALMQQWRDRVGDNDPLEVDDPGPKQATYDNADRVLDVWQPKWIRDKYFGGRSETNHGPKPEKPAAEPGQGDK